MTMEVGYIGRRITHEFEPVQLNGVPYMMTMGGQVSPMPTRILCCNTAAASPDWAAAVAAARPYPTPGSGPSPGAVTPQPFFETALGGPTSAYCTGYTSCTAAVVANEGANGTKNLNNAQVWSIWSDLDNGAFNFPTSMHEHADRRQLRDWHEATAVAANTRLAILENASVGYGNYNAGFVSFKMADWRGLTLQSNFTWSKALGTGAQAQSSSELAALDPFNLKEMYGRQAFDRKFIYNMFLVYQPAFFKGQSGVLGHVLGGWTFATIFTAGSGLPSRWLRPMPITKALAHAMA